MSLKKAVLKSLAKALIYVRNHSMTLINEKNIDRRVDKIWASHRDEIYPSILRYTGKGYMCDEQAKEVFREIAQMYLEEQRKEERETLYDIERMD